jgi:hypothetical protein
MLHISYFPENCSYYSYTSHFKGVMFFHTQMNKHTNKEREIVRERERDLVVILFFHDLVVILSVCIISLSPSI